MSASRNSDGNCITFQGSSNPAYFNACLSGEVDPTYPNRINVVNDIATAQSNEVVYEFFQIPYTEFRDADNNPFATAADAASYITAQGNVLEIDTAQYQGVWDADTNTPTLASGTHGGQIGDFYFVNTSGSSSVDSVSEWRRGDKIIWNGTVWQKLKATSVIDGQTYSTLSNTQVSIFADGEAATADEFGLPGWYYKNTENNKINWYLYGDTPAVNNHLGDLKAFYAVVTPKNTTSEPYFSVYTKAQGDGNDQSWYRSRITFYNQSNLQTMAAGTKYLIHNNAANSILDAIDPSLPRISLGIDGPTTAGPQEDTEELFLMALSTSSNYPEGTNEFTVERAGYVIGDHQQEFSLSAPPTTGASIFDQTPENIDFRVEATGTTILSNDGQQYSVNSIHAIDNGDGTLDIVALPGQQVVYDNLDFSNVTITGSAAGSNVGTTVNALNALFSNLPLGSGGSYQPTYPVTDATDITAEVRNTSTPTTKKSDNTTFHLYGQTNNGNNTDIVWSTETIDEAGEYFLVKIAGGGRFLIGLGCEEDGDRTEIEGLTGTNTGGSSAIGLKWSQAYYDYGTYTAPWTIYGSTPGLSYGPGWSFSSTDQQMRYNGDVQNELDNGAGAPGLRDGALFKIGIDQNGYITSWYYDAGRSNQFIMTARSTTVTPAGNYFLVVKLWDGNNVMVELPQRSAVDPTAPILAYRFIESPDGSFYYPLFASADEAAYVDIQNGGSSPGSAHAHVFVDEPTNSVWYMPDNGGTHAGPSAPVSTDEIVYTEIQTLDEGDFAPLELSLSDYTFSENQTVNIQIVPQDVVANVTGLPSYLTYSNGYITGGTPYVPEDQVSVITVERSNSYGTTVQTFNITIQDNTSLGDLPNFTETDGNFVQPNRIILDYDALLQYDTQINPGEELTYTYNSIPPTIGILSSTGESNLAAFDPVTDTLGTIPGVNNFAETANWDLRYVSFGGYIGASSTKYALVGWDDNTIQPGNEGTLTGSEFKLECGNDGIFRLYVDGVLRLESDSANPFSGAQTLTLAGFNDQAQSDVYIPANWSITSSVDTDTPPAGFVDPVLSGEMTTNTLFGPSDHGAVFLTETLKVNHRYVVPQTWIEANVLPNITGAGAGSGGEKFFFGVPKDGTNWDVVGLTTDWHAVFRLEGATNGHYSRLYTNGNNSVSDSTVSVSSATDAYYDYAIEWDGTDLHVIACNIGDINTQPGISNGGAFSRVNTISGFAGAHGKTNQELNLVIAITANASVNLTTTGLQQVRIPFGNNTILHGESSSGNGLFGQVESAYFDQGGQHAPGVLTFAHPTINAGYTYTYVYHPSMEADDYMEFRLASDSTTVYTTGVTAFDYTTNGDPSYSGLQGYKGITFTVPSDVPPLRVYHYNEYQSGYFDAGREVPISGSTYTTEVTGVTVEGPSGNFTGNVINSGSNGWLSLNETLSAGERLVLDSAFLQDLNDALPDYCIFWVGLKSDAWANTDFPLSSFKGGCALRFYNTSDTGNSEPGLRILGYANNSLTSQLYTASLAQASAFLEITNSGNNIRVGYEASSDASLNAASTPYSDWEISAKAQTGDQGYGITSAEVGIYWVAISGNDTGFDITQVDWTGLAEVGVPAAPTTLLTD